VACRIDALTIDANDPERLATFWAAALDWKLVRDDDGDALVVPPEGNGLVLFPLQVPEPKVGKNPIHLDLSTSSGEDQQALVARLLELGASYADVGQSPREGHVVLADPEGNELCVLEPGNRFVDHGTRLGSVTCDGSREVGLFWSEALGWPLVWDQDGETAIRAPDGTGPFLTWGPPVAPKAGKNRLHLDIAPPAGEDQQAEVERLVSLGARRIDIGQGAVSWVVMADPGGNEFCVLTPR
jgi:predicted enzyme related to lactoylglutathione lyase